MSIASAKISHNIIVNMYNKKPETNENGDMIFRKNGFLLFSGILLVLIFSLCILCMDFFVSEIMQENNINMNMKDTLYIGGYSLIALFILLGMRLIIVFFKHEIIISRGVITSKNMFSTKTINLSDIEKITFSNRSGLVFKSLDSKIVFGNFTNGLIETLKFINENIPMHKCEQAIFKAKKMLKNNRIVY